MAVLARRQAGMRLLQTQCKQSRLVGLRIKFPQKEISPLTVDQMKIETSYNVGVS